MSNYETETKQTTGADTRSNANPPKKFDFKNRFSARRLALMAVFVALSLAVSMLSFPIFPTGGVSFLKLDFGNVFILLISFLLGPIEGVIVCVLKETLHIFVSGMNTGGVGELANMLMTSAYILFPSVLYCYKKGIKSVALSLVAACFIGTAAALLVNRFITFPLFGELFLRTDGVALFNSSFWLILAFNIIKTASISVLTLLLYKRLSNFLKKIKI